MDEDIDTESGDVAQFKGKIALALFFEIFPLGIAHHVIDQGVRLFRGQCGMIEFLEVPVHTDHRWLAGADMTIRRALLCHEGQELRNIHEEDPSVRKDNEMMDCRTSRLLESIMPQGDEKARK